MPEASEIFQPAGLSVPGSFFHLFLLLSSSFGVILVPFATLSLLGILSKCTFLFFPRGASCGNLFSTRDWNLSLTLLFHPSDLQSTMQYGFVLLEISRAGYSAVLGFYSLPTVSLPPAGELWWDECLGPVGL